MMNKVFCYILSFFVVVSVLTACEDDRLYDPSYVGEGDAELTAEVTFNSLASALSRAEVSGGTPGDAIRDINTLCIALYAQDGSFVKKYFFDKSDPDMSVTDSEDNPSDTPSSADPLPGHRAEKTTKKATVKLGKVPYGRYRIYAVANIGEDILTDELLASAEDLKALRLTWNGDDIAANSQMFGYFSPDNKSEGFDAPLMTVNQPVMKLRAWVKRAVSKVTVAFDGRGLKEGVKIYIKSVQIKDIPLYCSLGANTPVEPDKQIDLVNKGQTITYGQGDDYGPDWIGLVSKEHPINGYDQSVVDNLSMSADDKLKALHAEDINGFYMFENLQGEGEDNSPSDKRQQVNQKHKDDGVVSYPEGVDPTETAWKDAKKYGSYIEVKAHYESGNEDEGSGEITYRFMLGKDTHLDYNAERNYHYKLTLKFNGWANDIDWHIDYRRGPDKVLRFPRPYYISYLYGQTTMLPIEFEVDEDVTVTKVEARILSNNWAPEGASDPFSKNLDFTGNVTNDNKYLVQNCQPGADDYNKYYTYVSYMDDPVERPYNGFLSLRKPKNLLALTGLPPWKLNVNESHYNDSQLGTQSYSGSDVEISKIPLYEAMAEGKLFVERVDRTYFIKMPIWTRARQLIKDTAYTGNNPFEEYYRKAVVHVEVTLSDGTVLRSDADDVVPGNDGQKDIEIRQVRRIVNPKGIWRSKEKHDPFHVVLKVIDHKNPHLFKDLVSDGPWCAYVMYDTDADQMTGSGGFIELEGAAGTTVGVTDFYADGKTMERKTVEGLDSTAMDFTVKFVKKDVPVTPRYAIIRVEYNYNSCYHLIFVRQGYESDDTFGDGRKWCTANMVDQNTLGESPLDEGSLFKYGNWTGIKSESNVNKGKIHWTRIVPNDFKANVGTNLSTTDGATGVAWADIKYKEPTVPKTDWQHTNEELPTPPENKFGVLSGRRIATYEDYKSLIPENPDDEAAVEKFAIKNGYGVLYGDGATETASTIEDAYGYKAGGSKSRGMRGCFVYNKNNGKNLFFPVGSSGYGHRKNSVNGGYIGLLRYNSNARWGYFDAVAATTYWYGVFSAPLFLDVFRSSGAVYWLEENHPIEVKNYNSTTGEYDTAIESRVAWDINYSTFDFTGLNRANVENGADACFIRCIDN